MSKTFFIIIWLLFFNVVFSQKDTLTYNDLKISIVHKKEVLLFNDKRFNGYLKIKMADDNYCFDYVKDGQIVTNKCNLINNKVIDKFKMEYINYSIDKFILKKELKSQSTKITFDSCKNCDTVSYYLDKLYLKNELYSGFAKSTDSVFFYYQGNLKFIKTFFSNSKEKEYIEFDKGKMNGIYKKYDEYGKVIIEGEYKSNKKINKWIIYNTNGYDKIIQDYNDNLKKGIWFYYLKEKIIRSEFYENNTLDYYYTSEFYKNKETRKFYKNEKNYAIVKYIDGHIDQYIDVK